MIFSLLLVLLAVMALQVQCQCQYYTLNPLRTNYSTFTQVYSAVNGKNIPIHVCNGAILYYNETVPPITNDTTIIGDVDASGMYAVWTIMAPQSTVFWIQSPNANAAQYTLVSVNTINIFFQQTLFYVDVSSTLTFDNVKTWNGNISVLVSGSFGYQFGFFASNSYFAYVAVGVRYVQGSVTMDNCMFVATRLAGIVTPSNNLDGITLTQPVFVNTLFPFATLVGPDLTYTYLQLITPSNQYVVMTGMTTCRDYPSYQAPVIYNCSQSPVVGGGGTTSCNCQNSETNTIVAAVALGLVLVLVIAAFAVIIFNKNKNKPAQAD